MTSTGRQTPAWLIEEYLKLRNKVNEIKQKHAEQLEPYATVMQAIEGQLLDHLSKNELGSVKSDSGTAYKQTVTSVTVDNWDQALSWIQEHNAWDLLERRVSKQVATTIIEESQKPIPGVKISQALVLRVRSS
jgi:hypothetical protein